MTGPCPSDPKEVAVEHLIVVPVPITGRESPEELEAVVLRVAERELPVDQGYDHSSFKVQTYPNDIPSESDPLYAAWRHYRVTVQRAG